MRPGDACILDLSISPKLRQGLYFSRDLRAGPTVEKPLIVADDLEEKHGAWGDVQECGLEQRLVFLLIEGGAPGALKRSLSLGTTFRLAPRRRTLNGRLPPPRDSILIND
jgi:hypothetical protein